ncbi:Scr1 family TA system antitoxin-like transcriptional regulator [Actinomadura xylanilytica]|nr:Scr1 family TA system antitoxin-like transcriptional regulator [Actinomadura xylanilytica]MDL4774986.1 Scr1 family TA system antitoxin-like transcriptional regulator [Actinomadura xylanilytica]
MTIRRSACSGSIGRRRGALFTKELPIWRCRASTRLRLLTSCTFPQTVPHGRASHIKPTRHDPQLTATADRHRAVCRHVPARLDRTVWSSPGFWIFDEERVLMETPTAELNITQPREVTAYSRTFAELSAMTVTGTEARKLILSAANDLV